MTFEFYRKVINSTPGVVISATIEERVISPLDGSRILTYKIFWTATSEQIARNEVAAFCRSRGTTLKAVEAVSGAQRNKNGKIVR